MQTKHVCMAVAALCVLVALLWWNRSESLYFGQGTPGPIEWFDAAHPPQYQKLHELMPPAKPGTVFIHLMFIPWDKKGRLKADEGAYDKDYLAKFRRQVAELNNATGQSFAVKMWTRSEVQKFSDLWCPGLWNSLMHKMTLKKNHPVMLVDLYRWLVVYCYGGIYWQFGSTLVGNTTFDQFLPKDPKRHSVKLFTETILTEKEGIENGTKYAIRKGEPEEPLRIYTSIFYATPRNPFVGLMMDEIVARLNALDVNEDYDILYITGNAVLPTVYDQAVQYRDSIELIGIPERDTMISMSSNGSWRQDKK